MNVYIPVLSFGKAGGHRVLSKMADGLIDNGCKVYFIAPDNNSHPYYPTKAEIIRTPSPFYKNKIIKYCIVIYFLYQKLRSLPAGIVLANQHLTAYLILFLPRKMKKYYYVQAYEVGLVKGCFRKTLAYLTYFMPFKKVVNSAILLPRYINNYLAEVPAGVDLKIFNPFNNKMMDEPINSIVKIGFIGRAEWYKGTKEIIKAVKMVSDETNDLMQVNIAIHKPDIPSGFKATVSFYEILNDYDLADFYRKNDIIIATGLIEDGAFHYPCAEGMACGSLVISNYAPLVDTDSIFSIRKVTVEEIASKLKLALALKEEDKQREIRKNIDHMCLYSWERIGKLMNDALRQV